MTASPTKLSSAAEGLSVLQAEFRPTGSTYLNTATAGRPPAAAAEALHAAVDMWEQGELRDSELDRDVMRSRLAYARLAGVDLDSVGIASHVASITAIVAGSLPEGSHVLVAEEDFTSVLFPFLAIAEQRRLQVTAVPFARLLDTIGSEHTLVAVSAVQSADGRVLDLDRLAQVAAAADVLTYVDVTQAAGWRRVDAGRFDVTACGAYKWLCCPRGAGFVTVAPQAREWLVPSLAGWYAAEHPWQSIYGPPLRLAADARAFQTAPIWAAWAAAAATLELLASVSPDTVGAYDIGLAGELRAELGMEPEPSPIVSLAGERLGERLRDAGIVAAARGSGTRLAFHLYNDREDVYRVLAALRDSQ
jgi:selenocysteine lyase/cysteine desulfurase